jgi:hypothetical protein
LVKKGPACCIRLILYQHFTLPIRFYHCRSLLPFRCARFLPKDTVPEQEHCRHELQRDAVRRPWLRAPCGAATSSSPVLCGSSAQRGLMKSSGCCPGAFWCCGGPRLMDILKVLPRISSFRKTKIRTECRLLAQTAGNFVLQLDCTVTGL